MKYIDGRKFQQDQRSNVYMYINKSRVALLTRYGTCCSNFIRLFGDGAIRTCEHCRYYSEQILERERENAETDDGSSCQFITAIWPLNDILCTLVEGPVISLLWKLPLFLLVFFGMANYEFTKAQRPRQHCRCGLPPPAQS